MSFTIPNWGSTQTQTTGWFPEIDATLQNLQEAQNFGQSLPSSFENTGSFWDNWTWENTGQALGALNGLAQSWLGFRQLNLSKDQFKFNKNLAIQNYNNQVASYNTQLADRQVARLAGRDPSTTPYASVSDYMAQNGLKEYNGNG